MDIANKTAFTKSYLGAARSDSLTPSRRARQSSVAINPTNPHTGIANNLMRDIIYIVLHGGTPLGG